MPYDVDADGQERAAAVVSANPRMRWVFMGGWTRSPDASERRRHLLVRRRPLLVMPHVAARTTSTIVAESGVQCDGGLGALTPRTRGTRTWRGRTTVLPLTHSGVPELLFAISTAPSARLALRRSTAPLRRSRVRCSSGLRGQTRLHVSQRQQRTTAPCQIIVAGTVPAEWQNTHCGGTEDHVIISSPKPPVPVLLHQRTWPLNR
jgi:hypothetical protein